jgi:hypothetical protein
MMPNFVIYKRATSKFAGKKILRFLFTQRSKVRSLKIFKMKNDITQHPTFLIILTPQIIYSLVLKNSGIYIITWIYTKILKNMYIIIN